ncbi:alpha/beta fold hydrolase [Epibacterium sp. SM1979]|uniref:Alpha/beta fold hydrolase n=1 Tax=Tritonibacter litoralis TaxID=2662264 RepID=A0A843YFY8_9RHOB|nr:alpha/beta hydrolase [Tritonibacter litoralis]MQQ08374.1 alpha/beta fold hydrolase [Tritonibacter litoralis]
MLKRLLILTLALLGLAGFAYAQIFDEHAYGPHPKHRLDVYVPKGAEGAPVILMLHGGGWQTGSKRVPNVWFNKSRHYTSQGYVFVSTNTRLMPEAHPLEQVQDLARALAYVEENAHKWGGDPERIILMGHSSGAHVATLLALRQDLLQAAGVRAPMAVVSLDTAALDVAQGMSGVARRWLGPVFGEDQTQWQAASPVTYIDAEDPPLLIVCSSTRSWPCPMAERFAQPFSQVDVLPAPLAHRAINGRLGRKGRYTDAVDAWLDRVQLP